MRRFFPQSFRSMLISLVLLSVLPALGVILYGGMASHGHAIEHAREELVRMVTALSGAQERTADLTRQTLVTLSTMDEVRSHDIDGCAAIFTRIMLHNSLFTNIALTDRTGNVLVSAMPMAFSSLADRKHVKDALRTREFAPGEYIVSRATAVSSFPFALPILDDQGVVSGVLTVALDLDKFHRFFANQHLPEGSFLGIADHQGRRLFRSFIDESFPLGAPVSPGAWKAAQQGGENGTFLSTGSDGIVRINAYYKLRLAPDEPAYMTIFIGMPEAAVGADARRAMTTGLTLFAFAAILALAMALAAEGVIFKPRIRALLGAAERFRTGDYSVPTGVAHDAGELGLLAAALDRMAQEGQIALDELRTAKEAAEDASRSKSEFLANMSHEIRTPLNGVLGMLQLLMSSQLKGEQLEFVELAFQSSRRLLDLLNDILDFSRIESGKLTLTPAPLKLKDLAESVLRLFSLNAQRRGIKLTHNVDASALEPLLADEARLRQILFNLVGNAVKFTREGEVHLEIWTQPEPLGAPGQRRAYFSVSDTGVGIAEDKIACVFERFTQSDSSFTRQYEGAGLGLAIVKRIVNLMGGHIVVDSAEGQGTTISFYLPLLAVQPKQLHAQAPHRAARAAGAASLSILVAEDDRISQMYMNQQLRQMGHRPTIVSNGAEALKMARRQRFDCVLMDVQMPVLDGVEATRALRELESEPGQSPNHIIAMTAYALSGDRERFLAAGMDDYLSKPVQAAELLRALDRVADRVAEQVLDGTPQQSPKQTEE